ncbi:MAG: hypothetical protein DRI97_13945, partial [Bacteroidetes bacterium]
MKMRTRTGVHKDARQSNIIDIEAECIREKLSMMQWVSRLTRRMCESERVIIQEDENIVFTRTHKHVPISFMTRQSGQQHSERIFHELGPISNICADWGMVLSQGLLQRKTMAEETLSHLENDPDAVEFLSAAIETIDAVLNLVKRYSVKAKQLGRNDIVTMLNHVPENPPRTFHEALQFIRFVHAIVWLSGHYHVGLGRFDQYMWPYLKDDLLEGRIDMKNAEDLLAEFFISLNKDSDL